MSVRAVTASDPQRESDIEAHVHIAHQFEQRDQQNECYIVGMWTFLVTEVMFFGALFGAYAVYRMNPEFTDIFAEVSREHFNWWLGFVNTLILLTSSLLMARAVQSAQRAERRKMRFFMGMTILCAFGFLIVKTDEYGTKIREHHVPGVNFEYNGEKPTAGQGKSSGVPTATSQSSGEPATYTARGSNEPVQEANRAELFFSIYFIMTGLHGIHVIIGILIMGAILVMSELDHPAVRDFMPIEMAGLYWHFVDIVWIFLYPLLYLIHPDLNLQHIKWW